MARVCKRKGIRHLCGSTRTTRDLITHNNRATWQLNQDPSRATTPASLTGADHHERTPLTLVATYTAFKIGRKPHTTLPGCWQKASQQEAEQLHPIQRSPCDCRNNPGTAFIRPLWWFETYGMLQIETVTAIDTSTVGGGTHALLRTA